MEYAVLGRSGLVASVIGLGGGGPSRLGLDTGSSAADAIALVRRAYELGVTLFEMTFGRLPYAAGGGLLERLRVHREAAVEFPDPWPEAVPRGWRGVLERLLAKNPDDRYRDYAALLGDLRRLRPTASRRSRRSLPSCAASPTAESVRPA